MIVVLSVLKLGLRVKCVSNISRLSETSLTVSWRAEIALKHLFLREVGQVCRHRTVEVVGNLVVLTVESHLLVVRILVLRV